MKKTPVIRLKKKPPATTVMDQFELSLVRLLKSASELKISEGIKPPIQAKFDFNVELREGPKHKIALVNANCTATLRSLNDDADLDGTQVSAMFQVVFKATDNFPTLSEDDRMSVITSGSSIAWPYIRSHIQSTVAMMGLPPVVVPLFHPLQQGDKLGRIGSAEVSRDTKLIAKKRKMK